MTKRYKIHEESNLGISFVEGRLLTWGDSLVKAWPKGLEEEPEELDCFGEVRCAVSTRHNDKTYGKVFGLLQIRYLAIFGQYLLKFIKNERSKTKSAKRSAKYQHLEHFEGKLRFALFATVRLYFS